MHDPLSLICRVRIPIPFMGKARKSYHGGWIELAEIWHKDPCKDGTDDSCGYFLRARHGDPATLERIEKRLEYDWDRTFKSDGSGRLYNRGFFDAVNGSPVLSPFAIALNLFLLAAGEHFDKGRNDWSRSWRKAHRFMRRQLYDILMFAENPTDSLKDSINQTFADPEDLIDDGSPAAQRRRKERIHHFASVIYGWVLRETRPWWRTRNLHVHHWRVNFPIWRAFRRWAFCRCADCGRGLGWNKSVSSDWSGKRLTCWRCSQAQCAVSQKAVG